MKYARTAAAIASMCWVGCWVGQPGCGPGASDNTGPVSSGAATASAPAESQPGAAGLEATPVQETALLAPDERRVMLVVVPGDALVEVDGRPVRRRNGLVELIGKVGDVRRVRARKGDKSTDEKAVTIKEAGPSPPSIDVNEPLPGGAIKPKETAFDFKDDN